MSTEPFKVHTAYPAFAHPFNQFRCQERLVEDYNKYNNLVVAFDFDNTIFDYHNNGGDYSQVISLLKECSDLGFTMVLYTAQEEEKTLEWEKQFCSHYGIKVDYVNESPIMKTKKPFYNILLDDRAGLQETYTTLYNVVEYIKKKRNVETESCTQGEE